ncbi:MAG: Stp1/IreP family PP2C-type Ser/Thr phosphatase [Bradymonadaceae bacterium]|nr:Stp1/IreP family PP2C-type Ser/Thr phosphatase [Lujinxingiaceae bacterium]
MKLRYAGNTDVGRKRGHNEDNLLLVPEENLYMVADGMGGHASGEVASQMAVDTVASFFQETSKDDDVTWPYKMEKGLRYEENRLGASIKLANLRIFETASQNAGQRGMGTTLVALFVSSEFVFYGHVGDSRAYRLRGDVLTLVTEDHSLLNDYIKMKDLTEQEIENFPHKNVIVRALGMKETVQVDVGHEAPEHGDLYLLCSDGLNGMITDKVMCEIMVRERSDLEKCCNSLIHAANENGGTDNVTVALVEIVKE